MKLQLALEDLRVMKALGKSVRTFAAGFWVRQCAFRFPGSTKISTRIVLQ
jgi:hypothetical protein